MHVHFTHHALERMERRGISAEEIREALKHPLKSEKRHGQRYASYRTERGVFEVCYEATTTNLNVITVYWV